MANQRVKDLFYDAGGVLRDMILENPDNCRLVDQIHQLVNHLLVIKGLVLEEDE